MVFLLFLGAEKHLNKRVCPSVGPSVRRSVGPSVRYAFSFSAISACFEAPRGQYWLLFFRFFAPYFRSNKTNYVPPRKLLKRRFICDQSQVSSSIRLEVIKNQRGRGQNPVLQKSSVLRGFSLHKLSSFLHNF